MKKAARQKSGAGALWGGPCRTALSAGWQIAYDAFIETCNAHGRWPMFMQRDFLLLIAVVTMIAMPAMAQTPLTDGAPGILGFRWGKNNYYFEPLPSGPQPVRNLSRRPNGSSNP